MRLKKEEITKIANIILTRLRDSKTIKPLVSEAKILAKIEEVIISDLAAEDRLNDEARKLLDQFRPQINSGQMDENKALMMIKKQLVKDKKMVL